MEKQATGLNLVLISNWSGLRGIMKRVLTASVKMIDAMGHQTS